MKSDLQWDPSRSSRETQDIFQDPNTSILQETHLSIERCANLLHDMTVGFTFYLHHHCRLQTAQVDEEEGSLESLAAVWRLEELKVS